MRKHFLILMLLALLPLATWADTGDISQAQILVQDFEFGGFAKSGDVVLGDKPAVSVYFTTDNGVVAVPQDYLTIGEIVKAEDNQVVLAGNYGHDALAALPVGNYKIKITGHTNFSGTVYGNFRVEKATLTISSSQAFISKDFGTANPTFWEGVGGVNNITAKNHTADVELPEAFKKLITYTQTQTAANANKDGNFLPANPARVAGYALTFAGLTNSAADIAALEDLIDDDADALAEAKAALAAFANNYNITYPAVTMKIKQVAIVTPQEAGNGFYSTVTETKVDNKIVYTYNGQTQTPVSKMTIEYKNGADFKTTKYNLTSNAQYDVVYTYSADNSDYEPLGATETPLKAGYYKVYVRGKENTAALNTNFYTADDVEITKAAFQIKKAAVELLINPKNEEYTGVTYTTASITPSGLVANDQGKIKKADIQFNVQTWNAAAEPAGYGVVAELGNTNFVKNVGRYKVSFKTAANAIQIQTGVDANDAPVYGNLADNYDITLTSNEWYITPRQGLVITAGSVNNHPYNTDIEAQPVTVTGAVNDTEKEAIVAAWTGAVSNSASKTTYGLQASAFIPTRVNAQDEDANALMANYAALAEVDVTADATKTHLISGTLTVVGNTLTIYPIIPNDDNIVYDGQAHKATQLYATANNQILTEGVDFEAADANGIQILYKKANTNDEFSATFEPTDAGTYLMKVANVKGKGSFASVTNPTCTEIQFEIAKKEISPIVGDLTLHIGDNVSKIQNAGVEDYAANKAPVVGHEPVFTFAIEAGKIKTADNKITGWDESVEAVENKVEEIITLDFTNAEVNNNYKLAADYAKGDLTLLPEYVLNLATSTNIPADIEDAAANGNDYVVTLPARTLKANTWYTMVLPFAVKTTELVANLKAGEGNNEHSVYAIVNRMRNTTTASEINFTLEMMDIPANEPFLIKVAEDVKLQDAQFTKKIEYKDDTSIEFGGNKFIGTYTAVTNLPDDYNTTDKHYGFLGNSDINGSKGTPLSNIWYNAKLAGLVINPLEAYLHYAYNANGNAPVITIEDFDFSNNTTAIKTLNTETMKAIEAEGMYNLNGMKLNSVPTQKGVYIINGKKVVIK